MSKEVSGLSAVSLELARLWGVVNVEEWNVCKYMAREHDPLPHRKVVGRIFVNIEELSVWAARQVRRRELQQEGQPAQLGLFVQHVQHKQDK